MDKETLIKTTQTLDDTLVSILQKAIETGEKASEFLVEQTPLVIQEMLNWYFAYNLIIFSISMIFLFVITPILYTKLMHKSSAPNWIYNKHKDMHSDPRAIIPILIWIMPAIVALDSLNLQWLKIWIAPKLYLIEKLAELTK